MLHNSFYTQQFSRSSAYLFKELGSSQHSLDIEALPEKAETGLYKLLISFALQLW
jgi:hypothetical protein